jgi:prepilin-type N-terminal cleavage/methylation domain-containing protein
MKFYINGIDMFKFNKGFTLIELLVVIAIIALLMSILMPALRNVRDQAKDAMCKQRLQQWGVMYNMYAGEYDGKLMDMNSYPAYISASNPDGFMAHAWVPLMKPYYRTFEIVMCPSAVNRWSDLENYDDPLAAYDFTFLAGDVVLGEFYDQQQYKIGDEYLYGSYGKNPWVSYASTELIGDDFYNYEHYFQTVRVKNVSQVPLFGDCNFTGGFPHVHDEPSEFRLHGPIDGDPPGEINRWNLDRHKLSINLVFLDWSVRKVGLKQLWQLRWSKETIEVGGGSVNGWGRPGEVPDPEDPEDWPEWMRNAKNYDL